MKLPVIDYAGLASGSEWTKLDRACAEWGFFKLENPPVSREERLQMVAAMRARFLTFLTGRKGHRTHRGKPLGILRPGNSRRMCRTGRRSSM